MTAKECIMGRRSIRQFADKPVEKEILEAIVETASYAPSWKNTQVTRYFAVSGNMKAELAKCTSFPNNTAIMNAAPTVIAVCAVKNRSGYERDGSFTTTKGKDWQVYDAGIATEAFCLAAYEQGIGSVILGIFDAEEASKVIGVPEDMELTALVPIGYPAESPVAPKRKSVSDLLIYKE